MKLQEMVKTLLDKGASRNDLGRFGRKEFSKTIEKLYREKILTDPNIGKLTLEGHFSMAHSELYYAGCGDLTNYIRKETKYNERWENLKKALRGRKDNVQLYMDVEFLVRETMEMSFVFGYLFGESYQLRDSESLQTIRSLIKDKQLLPVFSRNGKPN
jgi:hypothetical protein